MVILRVNVSFLNICCLFLFDEDTKSFLSEKKNPYAKLCPTLQPHGLQHARLPCPSTSPGACSNSCPCGIALGKELEAGHLEYL